MIDFYTWHTPNGQKIAIMLEETRLDYRVVVVDTGEKQQFEQEFAAISPNHKIPAIVDTSTAEGSISVFESGAILNYLGQKSGKFLGEGAAQQAQVMSWLFFQMSYIGPNLGGLHEFVNIMEEKSPIAIDRFKGEVQRGFKVLDLQLGKFEFVAGDDYSIADIAHYPWVSLALPMLGQVSSDFTDAFTNISAWVDRVGARPAVQKGMLVP